MVIKSLAGVKFTMYWHKVLYMTHKCVYIYIFLFVLFVPRCVNISRLLYFLLCVFCLFSIHEYIMGV